VVARHHHEDSLHGDSRPRTVGREGHIKSDDGVLDLSLQLPKKPGRQGRRGHNPEQLFAAGYAACFESALRLVARQRKTALTDAHITAHVSLNANGRRPVRAVRRAARPHRGSLDRGRALRYVEAATRGLTVFERDARGQHRGEAGRRVGDVTA